MDASHRGLLLSRLADAIERDSAYLAVSQAQKQIILHDYYSVGTFKGSVHQKHRLDSPLVAIGTGDS